MTLTLFKTRTVVANKHFEKKVFCFLFEYAVHHKNKP